MVIDGELLDPAHSYTVSTFSFLASGGDNFEAFTRGTATDSGLLDRDLWMKYLQGSSPLSPDFARQQVQAPGMPSVVTAGEDVAFELHQLDLTSLGSPANTEVVVQLSNGTDNIGVGTFPVSGGSARVEFTAPADLDGEWGISAVANPSRTTIGLPAAAELLESQTKVKLDRYAVRAGGDRVQVTATVTTEDSTGAGHVPTGFVGVYLDDDLVATVPLQDGVAEAVVGPFADPATHLVRVEYLGDERTEQSSQEKRFRVLAAKRVDAPGR